MTPPVSELLKLAERCEAATGPDRVLDYEIARALGHVALPPDTITKVTRDGYESVHYAGGGLSQGKEARLYTASLDAAMTLAPITLQVGVLLDAIDACVSDEDNWLHDLPRYVAAAALRARTALESR